MQAFDIQKEGALEENTTETTIDEIQSVISHRQLMNQFLPLGFQAYGGPMAHIGYLRKRFVEENKWITLEEFTELFGLCQSLPGPTSTQLVIAIGTIANKNWLGGVNAFFCFSTPSMIFMLIAGLLMHSAHAKTFGIEDELKNLLLGFQIVAIAIISQAAYKLYFGVIKNPLHRILWGIGAIFYLVLPYTPTMIITLIFGAVANIYVNQNPERFQRVLPEEPASPNNDGSQQQHILAQQAEKLSSDQLVGRNSLILYAIIFLLLKALVFFVGESKLMMVTDGFYTIGSLIIGGGHVVLPMILTQFSDYISAETYWDGFSLMSCLPGPMFNLATYVGAVIDGFLAGLSAYIMIFLPAFLVVWGLLPYWQNHRGTLLAQLALQGISAVAVGFVATSAVQLFYTVSQEILFVVVGILGSFAFAALEKFTSNYSVPLIVIVGGLTTLIGSKVM